MSALGVLAEVGSGRIQGGWGYVWVSYGVAWASVLGYALFLWLRTRAVRDTKDS